MALLTPCQIIDLDFLKERLEGPIRQLRKETGCHMLLSLKGFSTIFFLPFLEKYLDGFSASGMFEVRLGRELTNKLISTFSPAYQLESFKEISSKSNMVVFNSMNQFSQYFTFAKKNHCSCGIRINPQYSELPLNQATNPCADYSRLGITIEQMPPLSMFGHDQIEGLHLHTMCAQYDDTFERTLTNFIDKYSPYLNKILWINMGGGQLYSAKKYDIERTIKNINYLRSIYNINVILEPSEGILTEAGYYVSTVIDIVQNGMKIAILDGSAVCHIPDMVYGTWRHNVINAEDITEKENKEKYPNVYRLAGCSCYSGDIFGDYSFKKPLKIGDIVIFCDTASYSMVKTTMFNGIPMANVAYYTKASGVQLVSEYNYDCFIKNL